MVGNTAGTRRWALAAAAAVVGLALCCTFPALPALAAAGLSAGEGRDDIAAGASYMERGMFEEAVAAFSRAIAADSEASDTAEVYDRLGYMYWCRAWNDEALKAFRESLARADHAEARLRARLAVSQVLLDLGRAGDARSELEEALKIAGDEDRDIVCTLLGIARFESGDQAGAAEVFLRVLEAFPDNPVASSYQQRISSGGRTNAPSAKSAGVPGGVLFVNGGASHAISPHVTLTLGVTTRASLRGFYLAAGDGAFRWHDWRSPVIEWRLRGERDGKKPLSVVYRTVGPRGVAACDASIVVDREMPWGSVEVSGGRFTNKTRVTLNVLAGDRTSGVLNMCTSNDGATWSKWTMYQFTREWDLAPGDGEKTVYLLFQDRAGNISRPVSVEVTLDTIPPRLRLISVTKVSSTTADITWATDEESDSAVEYMAEKEEVASKVHDEDVTMLHYARLKGLRPSTKYEFKVLSRDRAGNLAVSREREFTTKAAG